MKNAKLILVSFICFYGTVFSALNNFDMEALKGSRSSAGAHLAFYVNHDSSLVASFLSATSAKNLAEMQQSSALPRDVIVGLKNFLSEPMMTAIRARGSFNNDIYSCNIEAVCGLAKLFYAESRTQILVIKVTARSQNKGYVFDILDIYKRGIHGRVTLRQEAYDHVNGILKSIAGNYFNDDLFNNEKPAPRPLFSEGDEELFFGPMDDVGPRKWEPLSPSPVDSSASVVSQASIANGDSPVATRKPSCPPVIWDKSKH